MSESLAEAAVVISLLLGLAAGTVALVGPIFGFLQGPTGPRKGGSLKEVFLSWARNSA